MTLETLTAVFAWMTTYNLILLLFSSVMIMGFRKPIVQLHGRLTGLGEAELNSLYFRFLAYYKLGLILFNLVPYLALRMVLGG